MTNLKIALGLAAMLSLVAAPAVFTPAKAASTFASGYGGYTNGYYHGPRDGQCYNNKRGC